MCAVGEPWEGRVQRCAWRRQAGVPGKLSWRTIYLRNNWKEELVWLLVSTVVAWFCHIEPELRLEQHGGRVWLLTSWWAGSRETGRSLGENNTPYHPQVTYFLQLGPTTRDPNCLPIIPSFPQNTNLNKLIVMVTTVNLTSRISLGTNLKHVCKRASRMG